MHQEGAGKATLDQEEARVLDYESPSKKGMKEPKTSVMVMRTHWTKS